MRAFWPVGEAAQADYETLRSAVLGGVVPASTASVRFFRGGLAALVAAPVTDAVFSAVFEGARRPSWSPHVDPREDALSLAYQLLLDTASSSASALEVHR
jgi:hypothetical protein